MNVTSFVWKMLSIYFILTNSVFAIAMSFQNSPSFSSQNIEKLMQWFVKEPHPMGTDRQNVVGKNIAQWLNEFGLKTEVQKFNAISPNIAKESKAQKPTVLKYAQNIIGTHEGSENCHLLVGGHYDTKFYESFLFVGANDGGSSTAFLLELARILKKEKFEKNTLGSCHISIVFFDGEEAVLPDWNDGKKSLGIIDNLYGSRNFVETQIHFKNNRAFYKNQPIELVFIADMIGHKKQILSITEQSDEYYSKKLTSSAEKKLKISRDSFSMQDDHAPFLEKNIPVVHVIDWTNLEEWHKKNDNLNIISYNAIAEFGKAFVRFLHHKRKDYGT